MINMTVTLNPYDYANIFNIYEDDDNLIYFNLLNDLSIDGDIDASLYTEIFYNEHTNWYALSQKYYGTVRLWWAILIANNIVNPFEDVKVGDKIKILRKEVITEILSQVNTSTNG